MLYPEPYPSINPFALALLKPYKFIANKVPMTTSEENVVPAITRASFSNKAANPCLVFVDDLA